jgi:hypothetical protein
MMMAFQFRTKTIFVFCLTALLSLVFIVSDSRVSVSDIIPDSTESATTIHAEEIFFSQHLSQRHVYISMGLCWKNHSKLFHKQHFPYEYAAR